MIKCACLVEINHKKELLLVRVRDNDKWYLPGGKIDPYETPKEALVRELKEGLDIDIHTVRHEVTIVDKALNSSELVELNCFSGKYESDPRPSSEISEVKFMNWQENIHLLAPAVITLCQHFLRKS